MKRTDSPRCLFVYGTLRRGEYNHGLLAAAPFLGKCRTAGRYTLFKLGRYPAAMAGGRTPVVGEVYGLNQALLTRLDRLEDYPREYGRERIATPYGPAWIYLYRRPPAPDTPVIGSGDWLLARRQRPVPPSRRQWMRQNLEQLRSGPLRRIDPGIKSLQGPILPGDDESPGDGLFCQSQNNRQAELI